ncbi:biotin synthase auxiliary protein BsaP [Gordonia jinhuaensis]|uniref:biotin synthase auxiliary protein BsaP n=1 Tax=Gordonia jinhuaensis TaxID=1517702 RepID=UPI00166CFB72|nr:hypothetical protein [Gordonia jinhuaensis]
MSAVNPVSAATPRGPLAEPSRFGVHTGEPVESADGRREPPAVALGLEPPRFCGQCARRMVVQVCPDGWSARCSRHGTVDSTEVGSR